MTTDNKATYYDLDINGTTVETRDIVRAVLERAGLGAHASHQLGKVLERAIRLGAKPGTDVAREVEKIHIEAGMLRDAVEYARSLEACPERLLPTFKHWYRVRRGAEPADAEPIADDDAEDTARVERCETCGAKVTANRQGCPICGAPTCCYSCCSREELKRQLDEARARIAELERERDEWIESSEGWRKDVEHWHQEANDQATRAMAAERELAGVVDPEQLQRWRTALSASPTETLTNAICRVTSELAALREYYRPRWMPDEPAPKHRVSVWDPYNAYWHSAYGGGSLTGPVWWTHQPPAPEAEREGE